MDFYKILMLIYIKKFILGISEDQDPDLDPGIYEDQDPDLDPDPLTLNLH
jgi:hypothetical protein